MAHMLIRIFFSLFCLLLAGCTPREGAGPGQTVVVFKHGKIAGDPAAFRRLLDRFEEENPGLRVKDEALPASSDEQHQFYVLNLEGRSSDFDVLSMDIIWVPEFARAGWLLDLSGMLSDEQLKAFFPGPLEAVTYSGRIYAIPWYVDAGLLYYRKDLLEKYGFSPPVTWHELVSIANRITASEPGIYGFIWQGKQYEGLVCNALEFIWSNGGEVLRDNRPVIANARNAQALQFMRDLISRYGVTPFLVTTAVEETTRNIFGGGRALFMRNWPYAWNIFQRGGSPVRGKVGVSMLPAFAGGEPSATLGGWQLGVNRFARNPQAARLLIRYLTSEETQEQLARTIGYNPSRQALYLKEDLIREQPFLPALREIFMKARPRPVTSYYMMLTQVMQPAFSAVISGIKTPQDALSSAERQMAYIMEAGL